MRFEFHRLRFHFEAVEPVLFPPGKCGNIIRGAFGRSFRAMACSPDCVDTKQCNRPCTYRPVFEPRAIEGEGPSGLQDPPRPFVIRAWEFDGRRLEPGQRFWFDLHVFELRNPAFEEYRRAFEYFASDGVGPNQAKAKLIHVDHLDLAGHPALHPVALGVDLAAVPANSITRLHVNFHTPTELKADGQPVDRPEFHILVARLRDRLSTLGSLYGAGPLTIDFRALVERAQAVRIVGGDLHHQDLTRRSGRTGQQHSIGGFAGNVVYEGALNEFIPYLIAGRWSGVGRQTVWGKGEIRVSLAGSLKSAAAPSPSQ